MAFCKFSSGYVINQKTGIENSFIFDFLPYAPESCVKVYLLGLARCANASAPDNTIENLANVLNLEVDDIKSAFLYWQEQGLVQIVETEPYEVRYLPVRQNAVNIKKFKIGKYSDFNLQMQEIIGRRMITPNEYSEYYTLIESYHMQPQAVLMIARYCAEYKGENVGYAYITTVAKDWILQGILTAEKVEEKIAQLGVMDENIKLLFNAMGSHKRPQLEDKTLLNKFLNDFGFELGVIIYVAKYFKVKKLKTDMNFLNAVLQKYYELKLFTIQEIEDYEQTKDKLFAVAKKVVKSLGLFYEDLSRVVEVYIMPLHLMGYDEKMLCDIADHCFSNSLRTLEKFNSEVLKLYNLGIVEQKALKQYYKNNMETDNNIKEILETLKFFRNVNASDRVFYNTWTTGWNFDHQTIVYAAQLASGKYSPINYMNKVLSFWFNTGINTLEKAKQTSVIFDSSNTQELTPNTKTDISALNAMQYNNLQKEIEKIILQEYASKRRLNKQISENYLIEFNQDPKFKKLYEVFIASQIEAFKKSDGAVLALKTATEQLNDYCRLNDVDLSKLDQKFECSQCEDTGITNDGFCECFKHEFTKRINNHFANFSPVADPKMNIK